jgi:hypothetical protein
MSARDGIIERRRRENGTGATRACRDCHRIGTTTGYFMAA